MRSFASIDIHWTVHAPVSTKKWCFKYPKSESALKYLSGSICVGSITVSVSRVSHQTTSTASFLVVSDAIQVSPRQCRRNSADFPFDLQIKKTAANHELFLVVADSTR